MDSLPSYSSIISPPTYEASASSSQGGAESTWPRDYGRQTPRIDVAKFYHDLVLTFPHQDLNDHEYEQSDMYSDQKEVIEDLPPSPPSSPSPSLSSSVQTVSSSSSQSSSEFVFLDHHHTVPELNRLLMQTWRKTDDVPSYEAFKAKVNHCDLRPIPNSFFKSPI